MHSDETRHGHGEHAKTVEFFDRLAATWDSHEQNTAETLQRLEELGDLLKLGGGDELLEVGCGTGQLTSWLCGRVSPGRVTAVDFSEKMLQIARTKCEDAEFRLLDVCRERLQPHRYDVVFCFHCVPHFHDMPAAINNLAASLKNQGRLLVLHLQGRDKINEFHDRVGGAVAGHHLPDDRSWEALLASAGLEIAVLLDRSDLYLLEAVAKSKSPSAL